MKKTEQSRNLSEQIRLGSRKYSETFDPKSLVGNFLFLSGTDGLDNRVTSEKINQIRESCNTLSLEDSAIANEIVEQLSLEGRLPYNWSPQEQHFINTNPEREWLNYLIYRYKFKLYPRKKIVSEFPIYALIEPISVCNLRCIMCYQSDNSFTQKPYMGKMDLGLFKEVVDELSSQGCRALTMAARGEPLLHDKFEKFLEYASGRFMELKVNTNAMLLDEHMSRVILESRINELVFSVDSHESETYERIRVKGNFDKVKNNIIRFHEIRNKYYPSSNIQTRVSGMLFDPDQNEIKFKDFWSRIADEVGYAFIRPQWDTYSNEIHPSNTESCHNLWGRIYIWWDGTVNPCEQDYKSKLSPGKFPDMSLKEIWHSEAMSKLREMHSNGQRAKCYPCDRCGWSSSA